jgi:hypothetical protein
MTMLLSGLPLMDVDERRSLAPPTDGATLCVTPERTGSS